MVIDVGELIWGLIGIATLVLLVTLVAVAWEMRNVLKTAGQLAESVEHNLTPTLQDVHHILNRVDQASAVIGEKVEDTAQWVENLEETFAEGRLRARDAWDDTKVWLDSLRVGWQAGLQVWRDGGERNGYVHAEERPESVMFVREEVRVEARPAD